MEDGKSRSSSRLLIAFISLTNSAIFYPLSSILYLLSSILYPLSSILYPLSSILYALSSILYPRKLPLEVTEHLADITKAHRVVAEGEGSVISHLLGCAKKGAKRNSREHTADADPFHS